MKRPLSIALILVFASVLLPNLEPALAEENKATIYVSIVSHNEEPNLTNHPDFTEDYQSYEAYRTGAVNFAEMLYENGAKYNFQSDWNFLLAEQTYGESFESTNSKNLLQWLEEDLNFAVDPHAHESIYSIADVAYLMEELGATPSNIVGGFIADPAEDSRVEDFQDPIEGWQYNTSWEAEALWGAATGLHADDSDLKISGIWRAKDNEHFTTHDSDSKAVIGSYTSDWDGLEDLLEKRENGELDPDEMYTVTIMNNQEDFTDESYIEDFRENLERYSDETDDGAIKWVTLEEALDIWTDDYNENPNIYSYEQGELTDLDTENSTTSSSDTPFVDIEGHWAEEIISTFYEMGIISGKSTTSFAPNDTMTRAELLKVTLLAAGYDPEESESTSGFSDVKAGDWFMPFVAFAYENGFIEGYSDGSFRPNDTINRAEALAILLRVSNANVETLGSGVNEDFSDISKADWFYPYVKYAQDNGIVEGYADGSFGPDNQVTRAEFVTMAGREFL